MANGSTLSSILGLGLGTTGSLLELGRLDREKDRIRGSLTTAATQAADRQARSQLSVAQGQRGASRGAAVRGALRAGDDTRREGVRQAVQARAIEDAQISQLGAQQGKLVLGTLAGLGKAAGQAGAVSSLSDPTGQKKQSIAAPPAAKPGQGLLAADQSRKQEAAEEALAIQAIQRDEAATPLTAEEFGNQLPARKEQREIGNLLDEATGGEQSLLDDAIRKGLLQRLLGL